MYQEAACYAEHREPGSIIFALLVLITCLFVGNLNGMLYVHTANAKQPLLNGTDTVIIKY